MKAKQADFSDIEKSCELCEFSTPLSGSDAIICKKHELIRRDSLCRKFRLDPLRIAPRIKKTPPNPFNTIDFAFETVYDTV